MASASVDAEESCGASAGAAALPPDARASRRLLRGWLIARTLLWATVAALTQPNAPLDTVEWLYWGREWCWGYAKHPPFPAWLGEAVYRLTPGNLFGVYLLSYAFAGLSVWCAWR